MSPDDNALSPHPLVVGLAARMFGGMELHEAYELATNVNQTRFGLLPPDVRGDPDALKQAVDKFITARDRLELVKFAGYLGDRVQDGDGDEQWQVMFLDDTAESYLLFRYEDIKFHDRVKDDKAAFGALDVVWVTADSRVATGGRMESLLGRLTSGGFMRAGDFRTSMSGGTTSVSDLGPLCTAFTPCCCKRNSP
jgi:hypothetical protein